MEPRTRAGARRATRGRAFRRIAAAALGGLCLALVAWMASRGGTQKPQAASVPPPPAVVVTQAIQHTVPVYDESVAQTVAAQTVDLRAQVGGTLEQVLFTQGSEVRRGQLLFVIDQRPYVAALQSARAQLAGAQAALRQALGQVQLRQAEAQLAALRATLVNAQRQVARDRYLVAQQAIAQQQLDNDTAAEQAAAANVAAQQAVVKKAGLNLTYTTVRAPIDGVVGLLNVDQGNLVAANQILATMSSLDPIVAQFNVSELRLRELLALRRAGGADPRAIGTGAPTFQLLLPDGSVYP